MYRTDSQLLIPACPRRHTASALPRRRCLLPSMSTQIILGSRPNENADGRFSTCPNPKPDHPLVSTVLVYGLPLNYTRSRVLPRRGKRTYVHLRTVDANCKGSKESEAKRRSRSLAVLCLLTLSCCPTERARTVDYCVCVASALLSLNALSSIRPSKRTESVDRAGGRASGSEDGCVCVICDCK